MQCSSSHSLSQIISYLVLFLLLAQFTFFISVYPFSPSFSFDSIHVFGWWLFNNRFFNFIWCFFWCFFWGFFWGFFWCFFWGFFFLFFRFTRFFFSFLLLEFDFKFVFMLSLLFFKLIFKDLLKDLLVILGLFEVELFSLFSSFGLPLETNISSLFVNSNTFKDNGIIRQVNTLIILRVRSFGNSNT